MVAYIPIPPCHIFPSTSRQSCTQLVPLLHVLFPCVTCEQVSSSECSYIAAPRTALSWGRIDQKAASLANGTMLKLKCLISNSGKNFKGKKYETVWITPSMLVPGVPLDWHIPLPTRAPALLCHPAKGRGLVWGMYSRTRTCPVIASPNFQRNPIEMAALIAGRRNGGNGDPGTTRTCKERAIRLVWWMLWHHHCFKTCFVSVAHIQSHQLKERSRDFCASLHNSV